MDHFCGAVVGVLAARHGCNVDQRVHMMYKLCTINLEECEVVQVEINQRVDGRSASPHGIQQKMCRDFLSIFSAYGALVAPQRDLKEIMIVARTEFLVGTQFRCWLHKECLKVKQSSRADSLSVEECLRYSIVVWLESHHYYRCGKGLLKGPFLGANDPRSLRILFAVYCTSAGEIYLRISFEVVRLFPLEPWQVGDPTVEPRWVFCLPKGYLQTSPMLFAITTAAGGRYDRQLDIRYIK
ncbi:hypothetical protein Y032_0181g841 [Ancylostoma ceylanicum]|uniref:DUF4708 domain-containing protein n=1 Tax=Ancylostoma ceylanicum TaxID=53326 RepID=A0A016SS07_9BILA|nr:hypothetical protein Y032_0181g841 [Ancylostoma ceylanicum]